jgi:transcriptional regulator with XRE-family HTH domain
MEMRYWRERADLSQTAAAKFAEMTHASLSRMELGGQTILPIRLRPLLAAYGVPEARSREMLEIAAHIQNARDWPADHDVPAFFGRYAELERDAASISTFHWATPPGILQTADYVAALHADVVGPPRMLRDVVSFRMARQRRLDSPDPPHLHAVMDEAAIRRKVGGPDVWRGQLRHLLEMSLRPTITLQVVPLDAGTHAGLAGPFVILDFAFDQALVGLVYAETWASARYHDDTKAVDTFREAHRNLTASALTPDDTRGLITTITEER